MNNLHPIFQNIIETMVQPRNDLNNINKQIDASRMNYKLIDNIEVEGIDTKDYPDFCDAYISYAEYDGKEMTDEQLEYINDDGEFVYDQVMNHIY